MTLPKLPPLPEPDGSAEVIVGSERVGKYTADVTEFVDAWSEEKVHSYALACAMAERERCANIVAAATILNDWDQAQVVAAIREQK